jgi:hypothetical protein
MSTICPRPSWPMLLAAALLCLFAWPARAANEGGVYVAGEGFSFRTAAERALAQNPGGRRFFLLTLPPEAAALRRDATPALTRLRDRVLAGNGVLLVCRRDLDNGRLDAATLVPEVVSARGWPAKNAPQLPSGQRYFPDEDPAQLPASNNGLRRLRTTCS